MSPILLCARPDCDNPVVRKPGKVGRPPIYCSKACRPALAKQVLVVELVQDDSEDREPGRVWIVRLRRGAHTVPVRQQLGRFTAEAIARELRYFLQEVGPTHPGKEAESGRN
jgi:hypothetical protein